MLDFDGLSILWNAFELFDGDFAVGFGVLHDIFVMSSCLGETRSSQSKTWIHQKSLSHQGAGQTLLNLKPTCPYQTSNSGKWPIFSRT